MCSALPKVLIHLPLLKQPFFTIESMENIQKHDNYNVRSPDPFLSSLFPPTYDCNDDYVISSFKTDRRGMCLPC
jgi:hypothetical protein